MDKTMLCICARRRTVRTVKCCEGTDLLEFATEKYSRGSSKTGNALCRSGL